MAGFGRILARKKIQGGISFTRDVVQETPTSYRNQESRQAGKMPKKSLKVDRAKFEGIVKRLIHADPVKREDVKVDEKKPEKVIPPQKS